MFILEYLKMTETKKTVYNWRHAIQRSGLKSTTRLVLFNLSCHMNEVGESCHPSVEHQAEATGLSKRAIIEHIQLAVDAGFLVKQYIHPKESQWKYSEYRAVFPEVFSLPTAKDYASNVGDPPACGKNTSGDPSGTMLVTQGNSNSSLNSPPFKEEKKRYKKPQAKMLSEWEDENTELCAQMIMSWVKSKGYCPVLVELLIQEFRIDMRSKGKKYADFTAAFQNYLIKGWLSKRPEQIMQKDSAFITGGTTISRRGVNL